MECLKTRLEVLGSAFGLGNKYWGVFLGGSTIRLLNRANLEDSKVKLLSLERELLEYILQVKARYPNVIASKEQTRCDLVPQIKVCHKNFYQKRRKLKKDEFVL